VDNYDPTDHDLRWFGFTKYQDDSDIKDLVYQLNQSNDFSITFALENLSEYLYSKGLEQALDIVEAVQDRKIQQRVFQVIFDFCKNHRTRSDTTFEDLCAYLIKEWV